MPYGAACPDLGLWTSLRACQDSPAPRLCRALLTCFRSVNLRQGCYQPCSEHWLPVSTLQGSLWTSTERTSVRVLHSVLLLPEDADLSEHAASPEAAPGRGHNQAPQEDLNSVLRSAANGAALLCSGCV